jgi:hypothetical protein
MRHVEVGQQEFFERTARGQIRGGDRPGNCRGIARRQQIGHVMRAVGESQLGDALGRQRQHARIIAGVDKARVPLEDREIAGELRQHMFFVVGNEIPHLVAVGEGVSRCGSPKVRSRASMKRAAGLSRSLLLRRFIRRTPGIGLMMGYRVRDAEDVLLKVVLHLPATQCMGDATRV